MAGTETAGATTGAAAGAETPTSAARETPVSRDNNASIKASVAFSATARLGSKTRRGRGEGPT